MSDDLTRAEARALADSIMGRPRRTTAEDIIDAAAANAPGVDDVRELPPAGHDAELEELTSGCPDDGAQHNPWGRD